MDKLEKALQKAREQREVTLQQSTFVEPRPHHHRTSSRAAPAPSTMAHIDIDEAHLEAYHILAHRSRSKEADIFRILRTQILKMMSQAGLRTLGITSPNYGDGKTTISLNLAVSIALDLKQTVLLADLDLRKPSVTEYLGIEPRYGITDYYLNDVPLTDCLFRPSFERLTVLPAGGVMENSSEILGSPKIAHLAKELKARYPDRIIIYDLPPTLAQDDPIAFLPHADAVLLVINEGVTKVSELRQCMHVLSGTNLIGTVLNNSGSRSKSVNLKDFLAHHD